MIAATAYASLAALIGRGPIELVHGLTILLGAALGPRCRRFRSLFSSPPAAHASAQATL
jgi:hypothetical protein